jgi:hypothetical protein
MENFKGVAEKYIIQIPIIQRDYAQGRKDKKASQVREKFLDAIGEVLESDTDLHLDFVYGSIIREKFIPLDGQQRLTTLFLLYWYFGKKEGKGIQFLKNFTYETRASSREFCHKLIEGELNFKDDDISNQIKDSSWFLAYWENDPTIQAMLTMISDIHQKFYSNLFFDRLDNIKFNFFELGKSGLADDLYIKMNARGKSLTEFEDFKAKFEKHISTIDNNLKINFSHKIDNDWTDFFWEFGVKDESFLIDKFFMNYFSYVTEMLHFRGNSKALNEEINLKTIKKIYTKDNIQFLFSSLDKLQQVSNSFRSIFSIDDYEEDKVALFDKDINILNKIVNGESVNIQQKLLLFLIINHLIDSEINDELIDLIRVARNLTNRIRHRKTAYIYYTGDLANEHIHSLLKLFLKYKNKNIYYELGNYGFERSNSGITQASLQYEIDKAKLIDYKQTFKIPIFKLEDYKYTRGDIHNFLVSDSAELNYYNEAIREIYSDRDSMIVRSMLTVDDYAMEIGWTLLGNKYFFGKRNNWEVILTATNKQDFFRDYLTSFKANDLSLKKLISSYLQKNTVFNWRYYFVKYPEMTRQISRISTDNNVYAWQDDFSLEKMGGSNLNAYHQNPYINVISIKLGLEPFIIQYDEFSYIQIKKIIIYSGLEGWELYSFDKEKYSAIMSKYEIEEKEKYYVLKENDCRDRIELLIEFINDLNML